MIRYILTKIKNKYKLYLCLVCGMVSMILVFSMIQMFRSGSLNKVIQAGFAKQNETSGVFPANISGETIVTELSLEEGLEKGVSIEDNINDQTDSYVKTWDSKLKLPVISDQRMLYYLNQRPETPYHGDSLVLNLGCFDDGLEESKTESHFVLDAGAMFEGDISEYTASALEIPEGAYPAVVSRSTADKNDLVIGEILRFPLLVYSKDPGVKDPPVLTVYISGIVSERSGDYFWQRSLAKSTQMLILRKSDFMQICQEYSRPVKVEFYQSLDYRQITSENVESVRASLASIRKKDDKVKENLTPVLTKYKVESRSVQQMVYVIVLPLAVLIITFIGLISFRIIESETRELQTLRDRGLSKIRLIETYFLSSLLLSQISVPIGLLLGYWFGKMVAGVDDFMGFSAVGRINVSDYVFTPAMIVGAEIAALIGILINLVPVILFFGRKKDQRRISIVPFWEKYFLDVILLVISVYLLFNYKKQLPILSESVMQGDGIDPVIFIDATLFLFACGLMMLRLIFYVIRILFKIGEKHFSAATYAGLLQIIRTRKSSGVISVFMVVMVAMSLFHANMARTINSNKEARLHHEIGADMVIREKWPITLVKSYDDEGNTVYNWRYTEPDAGLFRKFIEDGTFSSMTKVANDPDRMTVQGRDAKKKITGVQLMGINTKEFGLTADMKNGLNEEHFYTYLNQLAAVRDGVIISSNLAQQLEVKVGDQVSCSFIPPSVTGMKNPYASANVKVVAVVDAWPGYNRYIYKQNEEGKIEEKEGYLVVMNYAYVNATYGLFPYDIWTKTDTAYKPFKETLKEAMKNASDKEERELSELLSTENEIAKEKETAIIQITNGLFTSDFLIALMLSLIGYMIYWITSIRDRELLFGICRAMGISGKEVNQMILMEQLFLSFMSITAGVGAGMITSRFFAPVFAAVYLPQKHSVGVFVTSIKADAVRLGLVLAVAVIACIIWIRRILKSLNITRALKLGED
ncbi:MAG: hypothetical protein K6E84_02910 [Lachnospiraceae bacterium]|nr:hypothetical protein [Lachnospiraceae bacterium]